MKIEKKRRWRNFAENQKSTPVLTFWPENKEDIVEIITRAERNNAQVRAIGSSHSWSDVSKTNDYLVRPDRLNSVLDIDDYMVQEKLSFDKKYLIHVQSGITIENLNRTLDAKGLALKNLGGYDGQTISGVTSTSTHGSGITFGPMSDFVKSIEIFSESGKLYRVEPSIESGKTLTDPMAYRKAFPEQAKNELIQDDQWFNAVVVSMGCMGVIYSMVLEVRDKFLLKETRVKTTWNKVKNELKDQKIYNIPEHYELILNPYKLDGENACLITTRVETDTPGDRERSIYIKYKAALVVSALWIKFLSWFYPSKIKNNLNTAISLLQDDDYTEKSFNVFHIGEANEIVALSSEFALPVADDVYIAAIERLFDVVEEIGKKEHIYLTVPVAVRFVKATSSYLSPQCGRDTCMLEVIALKGVKKSVRIMKRIEEAMQEFDVRPHWGQINHIMKDRLIPMYGDDYKAWKEVYKKLNKRGIFDAPFTKRVGFN